MFQFPTRFLAASAAAMAAVLAVPAAASMTGNGVEVGVNVAAFLIPPLAGPLTAAIVFQPGNAASEREAELIERTLGSSYRTRTATFRPRRVAANALQDLAGAQLAFVTRGVSYAQLAKATQGRSILVIGSDADCARAKACSVVISSGEQVNIAISAEAIKSARLRFNAAFVMLAQKL